MTESGVSIDFSKLTPIESMFGEDFEEAQQLTALFEEAQLYLCSFGWCKGIKRAYLGLGVSDFIGIFLFELIASEESQGKFLWVVSGDIPPAHFSAEGCPSSILALKEYVEQMTSRCDATHWNALLRRIQMLDSEALSHYQGALMPWDGPTLQ